MTFFLQILPHRFAAKHRSVLVLLYRNVRTFSDIVPVYIPNERDDSVSLSVNDKTTQEATFIGHNLDSIDNNISFVSMHW